MAIHPLHGKSFADTIHEYRGVSLPLLIRAVRADDLPKLEWFGSLAHFRDINQRTFKDHQAGLRLMFVADVHDFPVGQVVIDVTTRTYAYLYALRVLEPLRGLGIGTELLKLGDRVAREHGFDQIQLAVEKSNTQARRLYERHGYHIFTERVDVWSYIDHHGKTHWVQEDVYGMRKLLNL
jgi:ribosomal protein S18 acetylase RimI-like enzyme